MNDCKWRPFMAQFKLTIDNPLADGSGTKLQDFVFKFCWQKLDEVKQQKSNSPIWSWVGLRNRGCFILFVQASCRFKRVECCTKLSLTWLTDFFLCAAWFYAEQSTVECFKRFNPWGPVTEQRAFTVTRCSCSKKCYYYSGYCLQTLP